MLETGQNWGKIANYPSQCLTKIGTPGLGVPKSRNSLNGPPKTHFLEAKLNNCF